jgi:D-alanyl-D-alanine carboxypeptidase/D-alanyl-D-alanine-endopeptidase (penicillin-binding protein 4)
MRAVRHAALGAILGLLGVAAPALATSPSHTAAAQKSLRRALSRPYGKLGRYSGAYVQDLTTGQGLFARNPDTARLPASVEKLYTTSAALLKFGPTATLTTTLSATGSISPTGTWTGTL